MRQQPSQGNDKARDYRKCMSCNRDQKTVMKCANENHCKHNNNNNPNQNPFMFLCPQCFKQDQGYSRQGGQPGLQQNNVEGQGQNKLPHTHLQDGHHK